MFCQKNHNNIDTQFCDIVTSIKIQLVLYNK